MLRRRQVSKERFVSFNFRSWASKNFRLHFTDTLQISVANPEFCACWTLDKHSWGSFIGMILYLVDICTACLLHVLKK